MRQNKSNSGELPALQAETRSNLYQPVDNSGNIASPLPGYDSVNRLLQYQRGELNSTGGYQNNGGGSVVDGEAIDVINTDRQRSYKLDGLGNWKSTTFLPAGQDTRFTYPRNNNYMNQITRITEVSAVPPIAPQYDGHATPSPGNGNLTNDGTLIYQYDALNRLIAVNRVSDGLAIAAYVYDAMNRRVRKTINNGGITGNVPNGTTDCCWMGWRCMEERNPFGGSGSTDTPTKQYVWGTYPGAAALTGPAAQTGFRPQNAGTGSLNTDECIQLNLLQPAGPQNLPAGSYYLLQDTLYRAVALTNSSGNIVEAYDTDAYGNTLIFTSPGPDNTWFTDDDSQSSYGANDIIYCGYRYDAETQNYYVRNRYYLPTLGRWLTRDPIGYQGGINLYEYVQSSPVGNMDGEGMLGAPSVGPWKWKKLPNGTWKGSRAVVQFLGTVVTNGTNPTDYHLLTYIKDIMKLTPVGQAILDAVNHVLDLTDFSEVRWRYGIEAAWTEHEEVCKKGGKWHASKRWVTGRHGISLPFYGPNGGVVLPGDRETSDKVISSAFDVAKEISKFISGGG